jgi:hypothetical protein
MLLIVSCVQSAQPSENIHSVLENSPINRIT